ncbi:hypothetical protein E2C01_049428 [Portunus trituberculatus]|uniref:Uncharacterized protein n=1 Tax=Portunus trituberculatus TaxID=210409 RepID=A0A5B7G5H8_PORTR|nr:hypothetical protein [Portunus trituberculatus]
MERILIDYDSKDSDAAPLAIMRPQPTHPACTRNTGVARRLHCQSRTHSLQVLPDELLCLVAEQEMLIVAADCMG